MVYGVKRNVQLRILSFYLYLWLTWLYLSKVLTKLLFTADGVWILITHGHLLCRCLDSEKDLYFPQNRFLVLLKTSFGGLRQWLGPGSYARESTEYLWPYETASIKAEFCRKSQLVLKFHVYATESHPKTPTSG